MSSKNLPVDYIATIEIGVWILVLAMPKNYAMYSAAKTADKAKHLNTLVEKMSSYCKEDAAFRDVSKTFI